jgi:hypothetical protein
LPKFVIIGKMLDMAHVFPAVYTRETGLYRQPVMVT